MKGHDLKRLRARHNWSQPDLAKALNAALGRNYGTGSISPWENDKRTIPADVAAVCEQLMVEASLGGPGDGDGFPAPPESTGEPSPALVDDAPGPGGVPPSAPVLSPSGGTYARACEELWEIVGAGVGMIGAAIGSDPLVVDGQIIVGDKQALGRAWGQLAETNETLRKWIVSATEGGAWLQVALATGTTLAKCQQNHASYTLAARASLNGSAAHAPDPLD